MHSPSKKDNVFCMQAHRQKSRKISHVGSVHMQRANEYRAIVRQREGREPSKWEMHTVIYEPHKLGLGFGPQANRHLNPPEPPTYAS